MSSEKRLVRPYLGLDRFQSILDRWRLRIGAEVFQPGDRGTISAGSFLHDPALLLCAANNDELEELRKDVSGAAEAIGLVGEDIELVVIASTPYLRLADIAFRQTLDEWTSLPSEIRLGRGPKDVRALETPAGGCDIDVYLSLARAVEARPLRPSRIGTWLGHVRYSLRTELGEVGFTPRPLTDEVRHAFGLLPDTIRFVSVDAGDLEDDDMSMAVQLYLDEAVLAALNQSPLTPAARFFQRQVYLDVVSAVVRAVAASADWSDKELADIEGTAVGHLVVAAAGPGRRGESAADLASRREQALLWLLREPEKFIALVEAGCAPREDLRHAIGGFDV